jgi:hypothetical protein
MKIIGLMGAAGAGKDTTADIIAGQVPGMARLAFADQLRAEVAEAFGIDVRMLTARATKDTPIEQLAIRFCTDPAFCAYAWDLSPMPAISPRVLMQRWGDYRRRDDPTYFIRRASIVAIRHLHNRAPLLVATDVRFENEVDWVRSLGGQLWRIVRPDQVITDGHVSETATIGCESDATMVNGGSVDDLRRVVIDTLGGVLNAA